MNVAKSARNASIAVFGLVAASIPSASAQDSSINAAFDELATHIEANGIDARVLDFMPNFPYPVRISNGRLTEDMLDDLAKGRAHAGFVFQDYTLPPLPSDVNKVCYVIAKTQPQGITEAYERFVGIKIEDKSVIDAEELALFFRLHEIRHCAQDLGAMDGMTRETDADLFAIRVIKAINPNSNIDRVVLAMRAADKAYVNAMPLAYALNDFVPPNAQQVLMAKSTLSRVGQPIYARLVAQLKFRDNGISDTDADTALDIATTVMLAAMETNDNPSVLLMHNIAAAKLDAYKLLVPTLTEKTIDLLKGVNMVHADVKTRTQIKLAMN